MGGCDNFKEATSRPIKNNTSTTNVVSCSHQQLLRSTAYDDDQDSDFKQVIKLFDQSDLPEVMQAVFDHLVCGLATFTLILLLTVLARIDLTNKSIPLANSD